MLRLSAILLAFNSWLGGLPLEVLRVIVEHFRRQLEAGRPPASALTQALSQPPLANTESVVQRLHEAFDADRALRGTDKHFAGAIEKFVPVLFEPLPEVPARAGGRPGAVVDTNPPIEPRRLSSEADTVASMPPDRLHELLDHPPGALPSSPPPAPEAPSSAAPGDVAAELPPPTHR